jgi:TP901 family phage tail tape measure protein
MSEQQGKRLAALKNTLSQIAAIVTQINEQLRGFNQQLRNLSGSTDKAAQSQTRLAAASKKAANATKDASVATEGANKSTKGFIGTLGKNISTIIRFYGSFLLLQTAIKLLSEIFIGSTKRAIAFEKALADLSAIAGLTNDELSKIEKTALQVAGTTSLTTLEVVELQKQLAKLGSSTQEIENLTRPVALLSQALGEEPGGVASSLKKALNQFGETSESANNFANVITGAVNESALSLQDLGTGLQYVGPLAKQTGLSFGETAALLGVLADNGFKASRAGTGLRQFLITAAKDGRPFNEFLDDLAGKNISLTRAVEEFKKTGASQAIVIAENVDKFKELAKELEDLDRLFYANAKQMGTIQGEIDLLASAYDNFSTRLGNYLLDIADASGILFEIIEKLDPSTAAQARAFRLISSASAETTEQIDLLAKSMINFGDSAEEKALDTNEIMVGIIESTGLASSNFLKNWKSYAEEGEDIIQFLQRLRADEGKYNFKGVEYEVTESTLDTVDTLLGLVELTAERSKGLRDERIASKAASDGYKSLKGVYEDLQRAANEGNLSEETRLQLLKDVKDALTQTTKEYNDSVTVEESLIKEKRMKLYEDLLKQINGVVNDEDAAREGASKREKKRVQEEIDLRKDRLDDELEQLKTIRDAEVLRASTIEDTAEKQAALAAAQVGYAEGVSAAYRNAGYDIRQIVALTEESKAKIEEVAAELERTGKITGSEGIGVFSGILSEFAQAQAELDKLAQTSVRNGGISQKVYEQRVENLRNVFKTQVDQLLEDLEIEGTAADAIRTKTEEFLNEPFELRKDEKDGRNALEVLLGFNPDDAGEIDKYIKVVEQILQEAGDVYREFAQTRLDNLRNEAEAELDIIQKRYEVEGDIIKAQLDNQLITESQYRLKQEQIRKKQVAEENKVNKALFEQEKKQDSDLAVIEGLEAIATATINAFTTYGDPITAGINAALLSGVIATSTAAKVQAIGQRKFYPKKFEDGGMVYGPSHDQGGIPFTVQGRAGYEMEGGEFIVNKRAAAMHRDLLESINNSYKSNASVTPFVFADGGVVKPISSTSTSATAQQRSEESVHYLRAIAEASVSTAINTNKPVRAFVTSTDLRRDESARRIKDNNTTI